MGGMRAAALTLVVLPVAAACSPRGGGASALPARPGSIEVAVTVDDLPRHGPQIAGREPARVASALLAAFARHRVTGVYGFINAERLEEHPEDRAVLESWIAAGHPLGNHTFAHLDIERVEPAVFLADIDRNEPTLTELAARTDWKRFRYPFLREGKDAATREAVRAHLGARGYRIAHVTIDAWDWAYNETYVDCLRAGSEPGRAAVAAELVAESLAKLEWAVAASAQIAGRPVRHILLLHLGAVTGDTIEELLAAYERNGVRWITLDEAMADPIYTGDPRGSRGGGFLTQLLQARGMRPPALRHKPKTARGPTCPVR
jgi:peptidoglycan/xylan/chitin deacetylase (PgdA/CDA1 family)